MNTVVRKTSCRPDLIAAADQQPSPLKTRAAYSPAERVEGWLSHE
jgi:hypothetical protein